MKKAVRQLSDRFYVERSVSGSAYEQLQAENDASSLKILNEIIVVMNTKKKYQVAAVAFAAMTAASFAAPSVYAQTTTTAKQMGQRMAGIHRGPFDHEQMLQDQADILGITLDDLKARLESGKTFKDIMTDLGLSADQIKAKMDEKRTAMQAEMKAKIQQEVKDGKITQVEADQRIANMEKGLGEGRGRGMMGRKNDTKFLEDQASIFGISVDDLKARLDTGKTIKDIATDLGISQETLQAKMEEQRAVRLAEMKAKIQQEVKDGKITQAQADKILERLANPNEHGFGRGMGLNESDRVERDGSRESGGGSPKGFGGFRYRLNDAGSASTSQ